MMNEFENIRKKALEMFEQRKYFLKIHTIKRMSERGIYLSDIKLVLLHGSLYRQEIDPYGDIRYTVRGWDHDSKNIRVTIIVKHVLIIITVIREEES